jgi:hypothetical protein
MEHRARTRTLLRRVGISAALAALLVPAATAGTAGAKSKPAPTITSISPRSLAVGETLTIRGHHFRRGRNKNTVAFKRAGGAAVFVKAAKGTTRMLQVTLPARLEKALVSRNGAPVPTKLRLRVLAARFGKRFSTGRRVPTVAPAPLEGTGPAAPTPARPDGDCDGDGQLNKVDTDDDNDLLTDAQEGTYNTDPCAADTDGDGVTDGYEFRSARDLNDDDYQSPLNEYMPYPGTRPYPNPLDATDANTDFDGDSLTLKEEFKLWRYTVEVEGAAVPQDVARVGWNDADRLTYSDGEQTSLVTRDPSTGLRVPTMSVGAYTKHQEFVSWLTGKRYRSVLLNVRPTASWNDTSLPLTTQTFGIFDVDLNGETQAEVDGNSDLDGNGYISDDERDEDADGLSNYDESHGRMTPEFWNECYDEETPYRVAYAGTSIVDPDSDGDGILDGADDQDHDDLPNVMELSRIDASHLDDRKNGITCKEPDPPAGAATPIQRHPLRYGRVNPFNPCLPAVWSRTCTKHHNINGDSAPFDESTNWNSLN